MRYISLRLLRKLASRINGLDLSRYEVGDVIQVASQTALLLMAEGWAVPLSSPLLPAQPTVATLRKSSS